MNANTESVSRIAAALPTVERLEQVDARLASIAREQKSPSLRGMLPKEDVVARTRAWLQAKRDRFEARGGDFGSPFDAGDLIYAMSQEPPREPHPRTLTELLSLLCWMLGPALENSVPVAVNRLIYDAGLPLDERRRMAAALAAERKELVLERRELVELASAAGVSVAHLSETRQLIGRERAAEKAAAEERSRLAPLEASANRHPTRSKRVTLPGPDDPPVGDQSSSYIAGGR